MLKNIEVIKKAIDDLEEMLSLLKMIDVWEKDDQDLFDKKTAQLKELKKELDLLEGK